MSGFSYAKGKIIHVSDEYLVLKRFDIKLPSKKVVVFTGHQIGKFKLGDTVRYPINSFSFMGEVVTPKRKAK